MTKRIVLAAVVAATLAFVGCKKKTPKAPAPKGQTAPAPKVKATPTPPPAPSGAAKVAARYGSKTITFEALDKTIAQQLYELRSGALEKMIARDLVSTAAKKAGKKEQELLQAEVTKRAKKVSEPELKKMYEAVKSRLRGMAYKDAKPILEMQMQRQKQGEAVQAYIAELKKKAGLEVFLDPPRSEVAAIGPAKGPKGAPITIVEFSDFECPYCSRGRTTVDKVLAAYPGKIRLYFRDFPLAFHQKAQKAGEAAHCADAQGKFWKMHDRMFDAQDKIGVSDLKAAARSLGLDGKKFDACLDSGKMAAKVKAGLEDGQKAGVNGTPAFFINGRLLSGAQPFEKFKEIIDQELARK